MGQLTATSPSTDNQLIDEQVHHCKLQLVEGEGEKKGRVYARGEFGHAANPTANGRRYGHSIWESNISRLQENLKSRKVLGELDHPTDGRTALQRASHVITGLTLDGDRVLGEAEILDTAKGRDLKAILAAGVPVGISSRGFGSTKPGNDGIEEVQDDYKLVTFDFVAEPADPTAFPEVTFESVEGQASGASMMFEGVSFDEKAGKEPPSKPDDDDPEEDEADDPANEPTDEGVAPNVGSAPPGEAEMAKRFADAVLADAEGNRMSVEDLRQEFADQIVSRIEALRADVEKQVRAEMASDPAVSGARAALEQVQRALLPFALNEDANSLITERDETIRSLRKQLAEAEDRIEQQEGLIETLTDAAREAGYRYHLECLLHEDDADIVRIRSIVGDVSEYDSPDDLQSRVEEAREEMQTIRLEEERIQQEQTEEADRLRDKNRELAEGLEQALVANKELALMVYATERLQTHPQGAKILRVLKRSGVQSREQVDEMIEDFREPRRDVDDLDAVRARVRARLQGGQEYLPEDTQPASGRGADSHNYNGLGASLADLKHLAGMRMR